MSHQLETIIGYKFKNPQLLETALTHTSYANESRTPVQHNERLEFLGDSVLQIVSADYLFHAYACLLYTSQRPAGGIWRLSGCRTPATWARCCALPLRSALTACC